MKILKTPLTDRSLDGIKVQDIIYVSGTIYTLRDLAHKRVVEYLDLKKKLPIDLRSSIIYHCGPLIFDNKVFAAGPTTSARMNKYESRLIEEGVKIIIGKGGMNEEVQKALSLHNAMYVTFTGGCGALASTFVKKIKNQYWSDLGMAESIWEFEVLNFGPLIVSIDTDKNSI